MSVQDFDRYIALYRKSVTDAALFIVKEPADAEDIAQNVFLKLYTYTGEFTDDSHVKAWLLRCSVNAAINHVRSGQRRSTVPIEMLGELPAKEEENSGVYEAVDRLEPKYKAVIYLYYYEGYKTDEAARLLGISTAAVKWRLKRARVKLRTILEEGAEQHE